MLRIHHQRVSADTELVLVEGELDSASASRLESDLGLLRLMGVSRMRLDLGGVTSLDSAGVGVILDARREARRRGGDVLLARRSPAVVRALDQAGIRAEFPDAP
ncbi:MAG: STAS domain-containing protein [Planctomycetales bacterium]|nr:STAS domain-containing protein [Planctomycetales bacterium]